MVKWVTGMLVIVILAFATVIAFNVYVNKKTENALANLPEPTYPVTTKTLAPTIWPQSIKAIGFIEPYQGVDVANEVAGIVTSINFKSGTPVKRGEVLVNLESSVEIANLKVQQAQLPTARDNYHRLSSLYKNKAVSEQSLEDAKSKYDALLANIESLKATIDQRKIKAPFSGLLGIRNINLGQYLSAGTSIVRLDDLSVMRVRFNIPQAELGKISMGQAISLTVEAYPDRVYKGKIDAIEPVVDDQTGQVLIQGTLPNDDQTLRGGMFANVNIALTQLDNQFVVPQSAIAFALYGNSIFVVEKNDNDTRVKQTSVNVLERSGNNALVSGKLKFSDEVVTTGILNLSNNSKVNVVPDSITVPDKMPQL